MSYNAPTNPRAPSTRTDPCVSVGRMRHWPAIEAIGAAGALADGPAQSTGQVGLGPHAQQPQARSAEDKEKSKGPPRRHKEAESEVSTPHL